MNDKEIEIIRQSVFWIKYLSKELDICPEETEFFITNKQDKLIICNLQNTIYSLSELSNMTNKEIETVDKLLESIFENRNIYGD